MSLQSELWKSASFIFSKLLNKMQIYMCIYFHICKRTFTILSQERHQILPQGGRRLKSFPLYQHKQLMRFLRLDKQASTTICGLGVSHLHSANSFPTRTCSTVSILIAASLRDSSLCPRGPELAEPHGRSGMPEDEATDKALYAKEPMGLAVLASRGLLMPNGL